MFIISLEKKRFNIQMNSKDRAGKLGHVFVKNLITWIVLVLVEPRPFCEILSKRNDMKLHEKFSFELILSV